MEKAIKNKKIKVVDLTKASKADIFKYLRAIQSLQNTHFIKVKKISSSK